MGRKEGGEKKWCNNFPTWVEDCTRKHNGKYDYSRSFERELDAYGRWVVPITCPEHGEFLQSPSKHKFGRGCPICAGSVMHNPLQKLRVAFPDQEFPDDWNYGSKEEFTLVCKKHGEFVTTYNQLTSTKAKAGTPACHKCAFEQRGLKHRIGPTEFGRRIQSVFPDYLFALNDGMTTSSKVVYVCPKHGVKESIANDLLGGHGCPECGQENRNKSILEVRGVTPRQNILEVGAVHGGRYIPHMSTIRRTHEFIRVTCVKHGAFELPLYSLKAGKGCPACAGRISAQELEIRDWLRSLGVTVEQQARDLLESGNPDLYLPDHSVVIEHCGLYWHREEQFGRLNHYSRYRDAIQGGMHLITLFEDEWQYRKEAVKKVILGILNIDSDKVFARNTEVRPATWAEVSPIYDENHLQGAGSPCKENYALIHDGEVVAAMSVRADRFGSNDKELTRYAFRKRVVGGFSKLLKAFKDAQTTPGCLVSYSDKRWFRGQTYEKAGFKYSGETGPGYWWAKGPKRYSRVKFQKHKLKELLQKFDETLTEEENMYANGYWKIWDCGQDRWILTY